MPDRHEGGVTMIRAVLAHSVILAQCFLLLATEPPPKTHWPAVKPETWSLHLEDGRVESAKMTIVGTNGAPLYLVECYLNAYDHEDPKFVYSGAFECRLKSSYSDDRYSTLLTEDPHQSRDWQSRGRFLLEELEGKCAEYPEYGVLRHFRLRGMSLVIAVSHLRVEHPVDHNSLPVMRDRIKELELTVTVVPDPRVSSEITEPSEYVQPSRNPNNTLNCDKIIKRK
jgi:hypothetical protein